MSDENTQAPEAEETKQDGEEQEAPKEEETTDAPDEKPEGDDQEKEPAPEQDPEEKAKVELSEAQKKRATDCELEVNKVLEKYSCKLNVIATLSSAGCNFIVQVIPAEKK